MSNQAQKKARAHWKSIKKHADDKISNITLLQMKLSEVMYFLESDKIRKFPCPHAEACIADLQKVQARFRKWTQREERRSREAAVKLEIVIQSVNELSGSKDA